MGLVAPLHRNVNMKLEKLQEATTKVREGLKQIPYKEKLKVVEGEEEENGKRLYKVTNVV